MIWAALEHGYNFFNERMLQHGYLPPGAGVGTVQILVSQATSYDKSVSTWFPYVRSTLVSGRLSSIFNLTQAVKHHISGFNHYSLSQFKLSANKHVNTFPFCEMDPQMRGSLSCACCRVWLDAKNANIYSQKSR
jgi:hypothetical protein